MATNTTNYNLVKPDGSEFIDVITINSNMDKIDAALVNASQMTDTTTGSKYKFGVTDGLAYIEQIG